MKEHGKLLSLCIPSNGRTEWVLPVVDSILRSDADEDSYEIVIEDNGTDSDLESRLKEYQALHGNIRYFQSKAQGFLCQIDCFRHAEGQLIKFVNHRSTLKGGAVAFLLTYAEEHCETRPVTYFSDGRVPGSVCTTFDRFVRDLAYWSSWSNGLAVWKKDLDKMENISEYNALFPHTDLLFARRDAEEYRIEDHALFSDIETGHGVKSHYNVFRAFAVEFLSIIGDLMRDGSIGVDTFLSVRKSLMPFLADLYLRFIVLKKPASYDFADYRKYLGVYYSGNEFRCGCAKQMLRMVWDKYFGRRKS